MWCYNERHMDNFGYTFSLVLAIGSIALLVTSMSLCAWYRLRGSLPSGLEGFLKKDGGTLLFMLSVIAVLASLMYSEVIGWAPCLLCWYQRIFFYPLPLLFGLALYRSELPNVLPYAKLLTWGGFVIALWHNILQQFPSLRTALEGISNCSVGGPSCFDRYVEVFGWLTIPAMSLMSFASLVILMQLITRLRLPRQ
jgi:disulfide bond formation protein DsbB